MAGWPPGRGPRLDDGGGRDEDGGASGGPSDDDGGPRSKTTKRLLATTDDDDDDVAAFAKSGPYVGLWIIRSVIEANSVASYSIGRVTGYLDASVSDYVRDGETLALWRVDYESGELRGDSEDLEEWELLQSAPRTERPTDDDVARLTSKNAPDESEYEKQRRERIKANEAFLASLGLVKPSDGGKKKRRKRPAAEALPEEDRRRSSRRCVVDTAENKYSENRAYKLAVSEARRDREAQVKRRKVERKLKRRPRSRFETMVKKAEALEKELTKRVTADRVAARAVETPRWLRPQLTAAPPPTRRTFDDLGKWWPQVGDRCLYFAQGHGAALLKRRKKGDEIPDDAAPTWVDDPDAPRVVRVVVAAALPVVASASADDADVVALRAEMRRRLKVVTITDDAETWFNDPVDYEGLGLHDYLAVVKEPMDLSTVRAKLNTYRTMTAFEHDVVKTFRNAIAYNQDHSEPTRAARRMWKLFNDSAVVPAASSSAKDDHHPQQQQPDGEPTATTTTRPPDDVALQVRLVPAYMFDDARAHDDDERKLKYLTYGDEEAPVVFDAFTVQIYEDALSSILIPEAVVRRACDELRDRFDQVVQADDGKRYKLVGLRRSSALYPDLPAWKAVKLKSLQVPSRHAAKKPTLHTYKNVWQVKPLEDAPPPPPPPVVENNFSPGPAVRRASSRLAEAAKVKASPPAKKKPQQRTTATTKKKGKKTKKSSSKKKKSSRPPKPPPVVLPDDWLVGPYPGADDDADHHHPGAWTTRRAALAAEALEAVGSTDLGRPFFWPPVDAPDESSTVPRQTLCSQAIARPPPSRDLRRSAPPAVDGRVCFRDVARALRRGDFRRKEAARDHVKRVYLAESTFLMNKKTNNAKGNAAKKILLEKRVFNAKLAVQLALGALEDLDDGGDGDPNNNNTNNDDDDDDDDDVKVPWPAYVRRTIGIKTNTGVKIREGVKLALQAARRDLAHDPTTKFAVVAELRLALALYVGNAAGPCREVALHVVDVYGGWYLGADVGRVEQQTVRYVKTTGGKIEASVLGVVDTKPKPPPYPVTPGVRLRTKDGATVEIESIDGSTAYCRKVRDGDALHDDDNHLHHIHLTRAIPHAILPAIHDGKTSVAITIDGHKCLCSNDLHAHVQELARGADTI